MTIDLTAEQAQARDAVRAWYDDTGRPLLTLGGYAGTGKTTTLGAIAASLSSVRIAYCCFTGKASLVLASKLRAAGVNPEYCGTIHSLIYECDRKNGVTRWKRVPRLDFDLLVIDEASMVGDEVFRDLSSYGIPILAVGDHGQLPPVSGKLNLMESPQIRLERVHRQAEGSPIIKLSMMARLEGKIPYGNYGPGVCKIRGFDFDRIKEPKNGMVLCGTNATRVGLNASLRRRTGPPVPGECVVCLRNDREAGVFNGSVGEILSLDEACPNAGKEKSDGPGYMCKPHCQKHYDGEIDFGDGVTWHGAIVRDQFGAPKTIDEYERTKVGCTLGGQFDYAYALTAHKAQGSEFENVIIVDESSWMKEDDRRRWAYTAITRAKSKLTIIG